MSTTATHASLPNLTLLAESLESRTNTLNGRLAQIMSALDAQRCVPAQPKSEPAPGLLAAMMRTSCDLDEAHTLATAIEEILGLRPEAGSAHTESIVRLAAQVQPLIQVHGSPRNPAAYG